MEAQNAREEFCHGSHGRDGDGYGAPDSVCGTTFMPLSLVKYPTGRSEAIRLSRLDQVFGEPSTHKVQGMHKYERY